MKLIGATPSGSYSRQQGSHAVRVGILDTGVDGNHPDIAPNFDRGLSRNFTTDNSSPAVDDGPCEVASCVDPADEDDDGHGTHVAGTIGAALNQIGIAGVAPNVDIVNIRAGQDSGFFFLQPDARRAHLRRQQRHRRGEHVVLHRSVAVQLRVQPGRLAGRAGSSSGRSSRRPSRAVDFARSRGVTLIAAEGNELTDLGHPAIDDTSPDFGAAAGESARSTTRRASTEPTEASGVIAVSAVGPPNGMAVPRKSFYSNYGVEQTDVAAPGGDSREFFGTPQYLAAQNRILAPYPLNVARGVPGGRRQRRAADRRHEHLRRRPRGQPVAASDAGRARLLAGHLRALPVDAGHVDGRPARGRRRGADRGRVRQAGPQERRPDARSADAPRGSSRGRRPTRRARRAHEPVPLPGPIGRTFDATCEGNAAFNGFYGEGIVNADRAVR